MIVKVRAGKLIIIIWILDIKKNENNMRTEKKTFFNFFLMNNLLFN